MTTASLNIRPATRADTSTIVRFIRELAEYEKLLHVCRTTEAALASQLFGERPYAECLIGELDGKAQGFALFFHNFSTFECKPGIYLEDLYVSPDARGKGLGKGLLLALARLAVARGCARLEWSVLDWNQPAIEFYHSIGAVPMDEWTVMRLTGEALAKAGK